MVGCRESIEEFPLILYRKFLISGTTFTALYLPQTLGSVRGISTELLLLNLGSVGTSTRVERKGRVVGPGGRPRRPQRPSLLVVTS